MRRVGRALLVHRDLHTAEFLERVLRREGFAVLLATTAWDALSALAFAPDVVISSPRTPEMSGADLLELVGAWRPQAARILLEASVEEAGTDRYFAAPRDTGALVRLVRNCLTRQQAIAMTEEEPTREHVLRA
jgi:DNA-binding response OmpR family regulator